MSFKKAAFFTFLIGLLINVNSLSAYTVDSLKTIEVRPDRIIQNISNDQILVVEYGNESWTIDNFEEQSLQPLQSKNYIDLDEKGYNYWAVCKIKNTSDIEGTFWLDVPGNYIDTWIYKENVLEKTYAAGNLVTLSKRPIATKFRWYSYVPLELGAGESATLKFNVRTSTFFPFNSTFFRIGQPIYFNNYQNEEVVGRSFSDGLYSAVLLTFCLYCLGYFFFTREEFAIWAVIYGLSLLAYFYQYNNTWFRLGLNPVFVLQAGMAITNFAVFINFIFIKKYLNLKKILPLWDKVITFGIYYFIALTITNATYYFFTYKYLYTVWFLVFAHQLFYIPHMLLGLKLMTLRKTITTFLGAGLFIFFALTTFAIFYHGPVSRESYEYLKGGGVIYIISILVSLSYRAAISQKEKISAETERLKGDIQLQELQKLDGLKTNFFANVSHELRTPLTLMLGPISSVLKNDYLSNRDFTLLKKAQQNGKDLLKLIGSILDLSKMEANKMQLKKEAVLLFPLTRRITAAFESHAQQQGIQYHFSYIGEKDLYVELDKGKLTVILNNLLSNALKFTPSAGRVTLTVEDKGNSLQFSVEDTGRGIHPNDLPLVFNRFYQSNQVDAPTEGGTGIGLALCKEFSGLMGGKIEVESKIGQGSTFTVQITRTEVLGTVPEIAEVLELGGRSITDNNLLLAPAEGESTTNKRATLLIVEDNHSLRDYIATILRPYYEIVLAKNGQVALDYLNQGLSLDGTNKKTIVPDLILSDIMMPIMDGFQLLSSLKESAAYKHIPIVMLTARAEMEDKLKALRIGVDDYLLKPFAEEELIVRIENLLENAQERTLFNQLEEVEVIPNRPVISQEEETWLKEVETIAQNHISDIQFSIPQMASSLAMSERNLQRQLKKLIGLTPNQYLQEMRLVKARRLLETNQFNTVAKVAYEIGFSDPKSFSRRYKQRFGKLPSEY